METLDCFNLHDLVLNDDDDIQDAYCKLYNFCMKSKIDLANSKSFVRPHVCHHCCVSGHIRPNCFKLYPHKQLSKQSQVSSQGPIPLFGELLKALSFLTQF